MPGSVPTLLAEHLRTQQGMSGMTVRQLAVATRLLSSLQARSRQLAMKSWTFNLIGAILVIMKHALPSFQVIADDTGSATPSCQSHPFLPV